MSDARPEMGAVPVNSFAINGEDLTETVRRGQECHRRGDLATAEECYRRVLAADPEHGEALHLLGLIAHATGNPAAAIELFQKAIARVPRQAIYHNSLGNALLSLFRPGEAAATFMLALELRPDFAECHNNLGLALSAQGRIADALVSYSRALALKPGHPEFLVNLGNAHRMQGDRAKSEEAYRAAIRFDPAQVAARENLCRLLLDSRDYAQAIAEADEAISRGCPSPVFYSTRGRALIATEQPLQAAKEFQRALALDPNFEEARVGLDKALKSQPSDAVYHAQLMAAWRRGDVKISINVNGLRKLGSPITIEYIANREFMVLFGAAVLAFWLLRWEIAGAISALLVALHYTVGERWNESLMRRQVMNLIERDPSLWAKCWSMDVVSLARPEDAKPLRVADGWHLLTEELEVAQRRKARGQA